MSVSDETILIQNYDRTRKRKSWLVPAVFTNLLRRFEPLFYNLVVKLLNGIQKPVVPIELWLRPLWASIFRLRGISYYVVRRTENGFENADQFVEHAVRILRGASEIRIAVGEMGHALMESPQLLAAVQKAYEENQAIVEVVHGPRVDLKTTTLFEMAKRDNERIGLHRTRDYTAHHFFLVTDRTGQVSFIDEGTHNETLWSKSVPNRESTAMTGRARKYYVADRATRRARDLRAEFDHRLGLSHQIYNHPGLYPPQQYSSLRVFARAIWNVPNKHLLQPFAVFLDQPVDLNATNMCAILAAGNKSRKSHSMVERNGDMPEWMKRRPIRDVYLKIRKEDIPAGPLCFACRLPTVKALVEYTCGDKIIVRAKNAPGYQCPRDGLEYLCPQTLLEFYPKARDIMLEYGDREAATTMDAAIAQEREPIKQGA